MANLSPIAVLGAGSWGSALALQLARNNQSVKLWSIEKSEIDAIRKDQSNQRYLPGIIFPSSIYATHDLNEALSESTDILIVVPSIGFRQVLNSIKPLIQTKHRFICATKGLDETSGQLLSDVFKEVLGDHLFAVLSGPSFAKEVAHGLPAAVNIASLDSLFIADLMVRFNSEFFKLVPCTDVIGVELGGAVKNVIAIATGIFDGKKLGASARSALITKGLAEMIRLGVALGADPMTFVGLSGLGDLILTCSDDQSRNRRMGLALGKGYDAKTAETQIGQVVEGKRNAELLLSLAKKHSVNLPICETVWGILTGKLNIDEGLKFLWTRS